MLFKEAPPPAGVSLLVTAYNRSDMLRLVLGTALNQSVAPNQIIVCDDGSGPKMASSIRTLSQIECPSVPIVHAWQADSNFRAARARNLGLMRVSEPYVIMIDGDCLLPYNFIERHLTLAKRKWIVAGGRYLIPAELTRLLLAQECDVSKIKSFKLRYLPLGPLRDLSSRNWSFARTCNLAGFMDDILRVDGFDEAYEGWGREDSDFVVRLINSGVRVRSARAAAAVAHLEHAEVDKTLLSVNDEKFNAILRDSYRFKGIKSCLAHL